MKHTWLIAFLAFFPIASKACEVCKKNQPKLLRGITHGTGPESNWDYLIVWVVVVVAAVSFFYMLKWIIKPGESEPNHIKRTVIE